MRRKDKSWNRSPWNYCPNMTSLSLWRCEWNKAHVFKCNTSSNSRFYHLFYKNGASRHILLQYRFISFNLIFILVKSFPFIFLWTDISDDNYGFVMKWFAVLITITVVWSKLFETKVKQSKCCLNYTYRGVGYPLPTIIYVVILMVMHFDEILFCKLMVIASIQLMIHM